MLPISERAVTLAFLSALVEVALALDVLRPAAVFLGLSGLRGVVCLVIWLQPGTRAGRRTRFAAPQKSQKQLMSIDYNA